MRNFISLFRPASIVDKISQYVHIIAHPISRPTNSGPLQPLHVHPFPAWHKETLREIQSLYRRILRPRICRTPRHSFLATQPIRFCYSQSNSTAQRSTTPLGNLVGSNLYGTEVDRIFGRVSFELKSHKHPVYQHHRAPRPWRLLGYAP